MLTDAASNKLQGSNIFTVAKRTVDGQDMLYQSIKLTNGIWVLAELRIQTGNPNFTVSVTQRTLQSNHCSDWAANYVPQTETAGRRQGHLQWFSLNTRHESKILRNILCWEHADCRTWSPMSERIWLCIYLKIYLNRRSCDMACTFLKLDISLKRSQQPHWTSCRNYCLLIGSFLWPHFPLFP